MHFLPQEISNWFHNSDSKMKRHFPELLNMETQPEPTSSSASKPFAPIPIRKPAASRLWGTEHLEDVKANIRARRPEFDSLPHQERIGEISKSTADMWRSLDSAEKAKYEERAEASHQDALQERATVDPKM